MRHGVEQIKYLQIEQPGLTWVLDIESNGLDPTIIWVVVVKNFETGQVRSFREKEEFNEWYNPDFRFVGHNILCFDVPVLNRLWSSGIPFGDCIDTLVLSYLYNSALFGGHSLDSWGERLKFPKGVFSDWSKYSEEMLRYCTQDVELTLRVYKALTGKMNKLGYSEFSCEIEHKIRVVIDEQQKNGFYFDRERADKFRQFLRKEQARLEEDILKLFPPKRTLVETYEYRVKKDGSPFQSYQKHLIKYNEVVHVTNSNGVECYQCFDYVVFNLGSPKQRVERLLELGWKPSNFTKTKTDEYPEGFPKVDEDALVKFAEESKRPEITALAEWLVIQGRASMLDTWFNNLGSDSRIHGRVLTCGATTRRMIHSSPNTANIPSAHKAKYGKECRSFWTVEPGRSLRLVGYDASGLETAGLCHYLNNPLATEILLRPKPDDIHTANSKRLTDALGWEVDREWGAKTSWYAWLYGAYPPKLGSIVGGSKHGMSDAKAGEIVIETFFRNVPGLKELISDVQSEFKWRAGRLLLVDGGYSVCHSVNAALNYKIQGLGAILMKLASIYLDEDAKKIKLPFKKVGDIHDEGQLEVHESRAEELGKLSVWSIEEAGRRLKLNVPVTGSYNIGKAWDETH